MKPKTHRDPCGCTHDGRRWLTLCGQHQAETNERHAAAQEHRSARVPPKAGHPQPSPTASWLEA